MIYLLTALCLAQLALVVWLVHTNRQDRQKIQAQAEKDQEGLVRALERESSSRGEERRDLLDRMDALLQRFEDERRAFEEQRQTLIDRIQRPEVKPVTSYPEPSDEPPYIGFHDDETLEEYLKEQGLLKADDG